MTDLVTLSGDTAVTMTSLELVEFINDFRREQADNDGAAFPSKGYAELTHADFLKKVPEVLGSEVAGNFSGKYTASNGKANPMYVFPKREACLMAMSYSYELQAKVYDRMTVLEEQHQRQPMIKDPRLAALVEALVRQDALEQEQERQATEVARLQEDLAVLEARTQPENKHFTVMGYANLIGASVDIKAASTLGRRCAALSKERGYTIGDVRDPRFGSVHTYHESVLQEVLQQSR
ncbi:hypothetical protein [Stenotrophomonas maltophilia]|uniref:hypothetical protein n=1 Tax=Stenotrophomonas maltophilia TaxID=40324 RepID=UPI0007EF5793|nr:hypothetical protein [Stenotrophomonas maltophilia]OBU53824.1 hypothetical protein A9K69_08540 [Stenotrophomonas maltophilia]